MTDGTDDVLRSGSVEPSGGAAGAGAVRAPAPEYEDGPVGRHEREERAERLKERIYISFAALAVVLALASHGHVSVGEAASTLGVTVIGALLAMFTAELISHLVVHERMVTRAEIGHALLVARGGLEAVSVPFVLLAISALTGWDVEAALKASSIALVVVLVLFGYLAARRVPLTLLQRVAVLGGEALLGLAVIGLQILAHG